jgi:FMN phosphatase YigB (HAD superfamily)
LTTLRDALSDALDKAEAGTLTAPVETEIETSEAVQETAEQREERLRDERGRFAREEQKTEVKADPVVQETRKPPSSWKKDYWGHWERLGTDPELKTLQDYIEQREADFAKGVSTYKSQWDQAQPIYEAVQPFVPELQQYGIQPADWIKNLGLAHKTLALGSPEQKIQMFAKLAMDYGIPLQALTGQGDPQAGHVVQTVSTLQRELQALKRQQEENATRAITDQIEAWAKDRPHYKDVEETMTGLLQSGLIPQGTVIERLQSAYDKAIRMSDEVWAKVQAEQAEQAEKARQAEITKKKAAAVSPKSSSPTGAMAAGNTKKSLRDQLSDAFDAASTGRF